MGRFLWVTEHCDAAGHWHAVDAWATRPAAVEATERRAERHGAASKKDLRVVRYVPAVRP